MAIQYLPAARADIKEALKWSASHFGITAAARYKRLIATAIREIGNDPYLEHSRAVLRIENDVRIHHLEHSPTRANVDGQIVQRPRHFIAYQTVDVDTIIVRVLHDRMEIIRQLEETIGSPQLRFRCQYINIIMLI